MRQSQLRLMNLCDGCQEMQVAEKMLTVTVLSMRRKEINPAGAGGNKAGTAAKWRSSSGSGP